MAGRDGRPGLAAQAGVAGRGGIPLRVGVASGEPGLPGWQAGVARWVGELGLPGQGEGPG